MEYDLYMSLQKHARDNYESGWDWIVECVSFQDFMEEMKRNNIPFEWNAVFDYYSEDVQIRDSYARDIRATAF